MKRFYLYLLVFSFLVVVFIYTGSAQYNPPIGGGGSAGATGATGATGAGATGATGATGSLPTDTANPPTCAAGLGAGNGSPTCTVAAASNNYHGVVTVNLDGSTAANQRVFTLTWATAQSAVMDCSLFPQSTEASEQLSIFQGANIWYNKAASSTAIAAFNVSDPPLNNGLTPAIFSYTCTAGGALGATGATGGTGPALAVGNCSSSASPAVCGTNGAGSVAIPTGVTSVALTVNTSAVTANSQIFVFPDDTLGTKLGVTCNSTLATLVGGVAITARTAGTSFEITYNGTIAVNPLCVSYLIVN